jgi:hypothetical protein
MKELCLSNIDREFILKAIGERRRLDGREAFAYRQVKIEFGADLGCCFVEFGKTKVMAQVSCEVVVPKDLRANEGMLTVNIELSPMAAPHFEAGRPSDEAIEMNRLLERCLRESRCLRPKRTGGEVAEKSCIVCLIRPHEGDYFAALAYLPMFAENEEAIQRLRHKVRDKKHVATCLGFGPRFLHSTGQDYKGGPNSGVFLQITADHAVDVQIPEQKLSFGVIIDAQAAGDQAVLESRGRRALRVHLGADVAAGLKALAAAVDAALA